MRHRKRLARRSGAWTIRAVACLIFAGGCVIAACSGGATLPSATDLRASPSQLDVGVAWVGHTEVVTLEVSNASRGPLQFRIGGSTPRVRVEGSAGRIAGGGHVQVQVVITPLEIGPLDGEAIVVESDEHRVSVPVLGEARTPPECAGTSGCAFEQFSAAEDGCIWTSLPDGARCDEPCVVDGVCAQGICLGRERLCPDEDGDACTVAACDVQRGCVLVPRACEPSSICASASCDPAQGCVEMPLQDGTYCGEPNCDQDHVCIAGACVARKPPDDRVVTRCLRGTKIVIPPGNGVACTVTLDGEGVCWGSVRTGFLEQYYTYKPDQDGPFVGSLGPLRAMWGEGNPLVLQRPDGETYYQSVGGTDWYLRGLGGSGRGLHHLPEFKDIMGVARYLNGSCAVTPGKDLICKGVDQYDPNLVYTPEKPAIANPEEVAEAISGRAICARMESGAVWCRDPSWDPGSDAATNDSYRALRCTEGVSHESFGPLSGYPPLKSFDGECGVSGTGSVYCHVGSTIPGANGKSCHPPLRLPGIDQAIEVRAPCALRKDGKVWCWGAFFDFYASTFVWPKPIAGLDHVVDFGFGYPFPNDWTHSPLLCAVRNDGLIKCVGENRHGAAGVFEGDDGGKRPDFVLVPTAIAIPDAGMDLNL